METYIIFGTETLVDGPKFLAVINLCIFVKVIVSFVELLDALVQGLIGNITIALQTFKQHHGGITHRLVTFIFYFCVSGDCGLDITADSNENTYIQSY